MTIDTYKVEAAVMGSGYAKDPETILCYRVYFILFRNGIKYDASADFGSECDRSFAEWNVFIHDLLSSDTL